MAMFNNEYPYTDFHELNLDFILKKTQEAANTLEWIKAHVDEVVEDETKAAVDQYFNSIMIDAIYDEDTETITLLKEATGDGEHTFDVTNSAMIIE